MRYQIVHDTPGRLRVRCGTYAFDKEQGKGLADLLLLQDCVRDVAVSVANGGILIYYDDGRRQDVFAILEGLGREVLQLVREKTTEELELERIDRRFKLRLVGMLFRRLVLRRFLPYPVRMFFTLRRAIRCWFLGIESLAAGRLDVAVLDAAAILAAMGQGSMETASSIMFLLKLSELLEDYTRRRTRSVLAHSLAINVDRVWLISKGEEERLIPMSQLKIGDRVRVRTGSMIPVDGTVRDGEAMVNESTMTGEPLPALKRSGSSVFAGTVLEEGSLAVEVTALSCETRIHQIVNMIDRSEDLKAGIQSRAESLADRIVPFSLFGSLLIGILTGSMTKALSVLMVDYSCAIKLSTPICVISAMREAAAHKIMVKGGKYLEAFAEADTIVFDKTGTLTEACPKVERVIPLGKYEENEVLRISACIEEHFPHSMARAVVAKAKERELRHEEEHAEVEYIVAHGVATTLHGERVLIGSGHFVFDDEKTEFTEEQMNAVREAGKGCSLLYLAVAGRLEGVIAISDPPRKEAAEVIERLKSLGITRVVMLTGDNREAAETVCKALNISEFVAQVLPGDKAVLVEKYKAQSKKLIMVGDGINDSPALAAADVSVAMKDASDIARETADITLLSANLTELVALRTLSRRLMGRIGRNYLFILLFNSGLLAGGAAGALSPSAAAVLHNGSTIGVCAASMRPCLPESMEEAEPMNH